MGCCASAQKQMKGMSISKRLFPAASSPLKEKPKKDDHHQVLEISSKSLDPKGSKDEAFYDSRAWLDSDCEDDFFSITGDFTPSCCSTPGRQQASTAVTPKPNAVSTAFSTDGFSGGNSELSPNTRGKLAQLLQETLLSEKLSNGGTEQQGHADGKSEQVLAVGPYDTDDEAMPGKKQAVACCLPKLVPRVALNHRKPNHIAV